MKVIVLALIDTAIKMLAGVGIFTLSVYAKPLSNMVGAMAGIY
jgi:hypothetical protein